MILIQCRQGTPEWLQARAGACTASRFADAISTVGGLTEQQQMYVSLVLSGIPESDALAAAGYKAKPTAASIVKALKGEKVGSPSDVAMRYAADLAIEHISGRPYGEPPKSWLLNRGHELEDQARIAYEARTGYLVEETGVVLTDDRKFGYSTDGMPEDGLIEIKCPIDSTKIVQMWQTGDVSAYIHQMQGGMWITGRKWCDFIMYVPDLESVGKDLYIKRIRRDDNFIDAMVEDLLIFDGHVQYFEALFRMGSVMNEQTPQDTPSSAEELDAEAKQDQLSERRIAMLEAAQAARESEEDVVDATFIPPAPTLADVLNAVAPPEIAKVMTPPTLKLGEICSRIAPLSISADGLRQLGFEPAGRERSAVLYFESDWPAMRNAMASHIGASESQKQAA